MWRLVSSTSITIELCDCQICSLVNVRQRYVACNTLSLYIFATYLRLSPILQADGVSTPRTVAKAHVPVQRMRWLLWRVARSRLTEGISRESVQKVVEHYWACVGQRRCALKRQQTLAKEGCRASADHTYHVVSSLAAYNDQGKPVALKASLTSVMGQDYVLGTKVC